MSDDLVDCPRCHGELTVLAAAQTTTEWPMAPASNWVDLWEDLKEALEPHEYEALQAWTEFPDELPLGGANWKRAADWAWREAHNVPGQLLSKPALLGACIARAVKERQEGEEELKRRAAKPANGKTVVLHVHASNNTIPKKVPPNHIHRIVSTTDQADALRGGSYSSVKVHDSELWTGDPNGLLGYLVRDVLAPMNVKITTPSNVATGPGLS